MSHLSVFFPVPFKIQKKCFISKLFRLTAYFKIIFKYDGHLLYRKCVPIRAEQVINYLLNYVIQWFPKLPKAWPPFDKKKCLKPPLSTNSQNKIEKAKNDPTKWIDVFQIFLFKLYYNDKNWENVMPYEQMALNVW